MIHNCIKRLVPSYSTKHFTDNFTISHRITRNLAYVYLSADCLLISRLSFLEAPKTLNAFPIISVINCLTTWSQGHLFYYLDFLTCLDRNLLFTITVVFCTFHWLKCGIRGSFNTEWPANIMIILQTSSK